MSDPLQPLQFKFMKREYMDETNWSEKDPIYRVTAHSGKAQVGEMNWNRHGLRYIGVEPEAQRQGVATAMWNEGQRIAASKKNVPAPQHSNERTDAGDAWARSVGGRLPRRI